MNCFWDVYIYSVADKEIFDPRLPLKQLCRILPYCFSVRPGFTWVFVTDCAWDALLKICSALRNTARRCNQSILKEISPEYTLEGLMLKLKLQYFGHLMQRTNSLEKTLMLGKTEGGRRRGRQRMRGWMASPTQWTWVWVNSGCWWWTGRPGVLQSMGSQRVGQNWVTEPNWLRK